MRGEQYYNILKAVFLIAIMNQKLLTVKLLIFFDKV